MPETDNRQKEKSSNPTINRVLRVYQPGENPRLALAQETLPQPADDEVRLKLTSIGLNRADLLFQQQRYFEKAQEGSRIGFEGAGIVDACGSASPFKPGQRVAVCPMSITAHEQGCMSDYALFKSHQLLPSPDKISDTDSGAFWMAYLTAWGGLFDAGQLKSGQSVLINAASSSVGIAAIQLAKAQGCRVIATGTQVEKFDHLRAQGADAVLHQAKEPDDYAAFESAIMEATDGHGLDLSFDAVAGPAVRCLIKCSKRGGRLIIHGRLDRRPMDVHAGVLMKRLLTLQGYTLDQTLGNESKMTQAAQVIRAGIDSDSLRPLISKRFPLAQYQEAFDYLASNRQLGKVVVCP